jgi:2-hydroxychromene-2-carboxylate isomerase
MEPSFNRKLYIKLATSWLKSTTRKSLLDWWYISVPLLLKKTLKLDVYLALNDPYSYLLVQLLPALEQQLNVKITLYLISENLPCKTQNANEWHRWAMQDCIILAKQFKLNFVAKRPTNKAVITGQQLWQLQPKTINNAIEIFNSTWENSFSTHFPHSTPVINTLIRHQTSLIKKGFYLPASIYCAGEWFWGLDRLIFLQHRLAKLTNNTTSELINNIPKQTDEFSFASTQAHIVREITEKAQHIKQTRELTVYLSLRSPYSYLGWIKAKNLAKKYGLVLQVKPVLPLMMQGAKLSKNKVKYIYLDVLRHCELYQLPFNKFSDPLGKGVLNCYQLFLYAAEHNLTVEFFDTMFAAVYDKGLDLANPDIVKNLCLTIGIDYDSALAFDAQNPWLTQVQQNLDELKAYNLWGVPTFKYEDTVVWGQDRINLIEQAIKQYDEQIDISHINKSQDKRIDVY